MSPTKEIVRGNNDKLSPSLSPSLSVTFYIDWSTKNIWSRFIGPRLVQLLTQWWFPASPSMASSLIHSLSHMESLKALRVDLSYSLFTLSHWVISSTVTMSDIISMPMVHNFFSSFILPKIIWSQLSNAWKSVAQMCRARWQRITSNWTEVNLSSYY